MPVYVEPGVSIGEKPLVLFENVLLGGTSETGILENAFDGNTYDFLTTTMNQNEIVAPGSVNANCVAIAAHNIGSKGGNILVQRFNGTNWIKRAEFFPIDDSTIIILFEEVVNEPIRIVLRAARVSIGVLMAGMALQFPGGVLPGYEPLRYRQDVEILSGISNSGQFMGQRVKTRNSLVDINFGLMDREWFDEFGAPFHDHYRDAKPFFIATRPGVMDAEGAYCWRSQSQSMRVSMETGDLLNVSLGASAYAR